MPDQWYYRSNGVQQGPVSGRELKALAAARRLQPTDLVWRAGMAEWLPAAKVKGLFPVAECQPPPPATPDKGPFDLDSLVANVQDMIAKASERMQATMRGQSENKAPADPPSPGSSKHQGQSPGPIQFEPTGAGKSDSHAPPEATSDPGASETADQLLARIEQFLQRIYDTSVPVAGLDAELAGLRRTVEARQAWLRRAADLNEQDRRESEKHAAALREAMRLKSRAEEARGKGQSGEADRLTAEARKVLTGVPRLTREEREAELTRRRERLEQLRGEGEVMAGAADLLRQAVADLDRRRQIEDTTRSRQAAAAPQPAAANPASGFGAWYGRAFGLLAAGPPAVSWPAQAALWTLGLGFLWIPMLYLAGKSLSCPNCGLLWVRTTEGEKLLDRQRGFGQVAREDSHYDREGRYVGGTRRTEQVVVNNDLVRVHYACKSCGHRWAETERRQTEA